MKGLTMNVKNIPSWRHAIPTAAGISIAALALSACSGGSTSSGSTPLAEETGPVQITLATPSTQGGVPNYYQQFADAFHQKNPNVTIKIIESPNDQHGQTIRTQLQAGNAPDMFYVSAGRGDVDSFSALADAGYLHELTDQGWASNTVPDSAKELYFNDEEKLYAIPTDLVPVTMILNVAVLEEKGLKPATTLNELVSQCAELRKDGKSLFVVAGTSVANTGLHALQIAASTVYAEDPEWDEKRAKKEVMFADSEWKKVLEQIVEFKEAGCYQEGVAGAGFDQLFPSVAQGKASAVFAPAGAIPALRGQVPNGKFDVGVMPGESADDSRLIASPWFALAANEAGEHKATVLKFMEFLAQPENQDALAKSDGNVSLTAALKGQAPDTYAALKPYFEDSRKIVGQPNLIWPNSAVYDALGQGVQGLLTGQATPDQVLKNLDDAYNRGA